jgi:hypothetical protein
MNVRHPFDAEIFTCNGTAWRLAESGRARYGSRSLYELSPMWLCGVGERGERDYCLDVCLEITFGRQLRRQRRLLFPRLGVRQLFSCVTISGLTVDCGSSMSNTTSGGVCLPARARDLAPRHPMDP